MRVTRRRRERSVAEAPELRSGDPYMHGTAGLIDQRGMEQTIALERVTIQRREPSFALIRSAALVFRVIAFGVSL